MVLKGNKIWPICGQNDGLERKVLYGLILVQFSAQWSWKEMVLKEVAMNKIVDNFDNNGWI